MKSSSLPPGASTGLFAEDQLRYTPVLALWKNGCGATTASHCIADVRHREDGVPGPLIAQKIRDRMEQSRLDRVPRIGSAAQLPGGGPGYESILIGASLRTFMRYTPNSVLVSGKRAAVVFALHGAKGRAGKLQPYLGLNAVADKEGFIVVYPQGIDDVWNDGRENDDRGAKVLSAADDVKFLDLLADSLVASGVADPSRLYLAGVSNGGFMTMRMACAKSAKFAAFATVVASFPQAGRTDCKPGRPVALLMINGTEDALVRYDGGESRIGVKGNLPVPDAARFFADLDGCTSVTDFAIDKRDASDPTSVSQRLWTGCKDAASVALYTVTGGGHQAPATGKVSGGIILEWALGTRSRQLDTAETLWGFFKRYGR